MEALERIDQILQTLENELDVYDKLIESKTKAEAKYKALHSKEWLAASVNPDLKTVPDKTAYIEDRLENEYLDYRLAEGRAEAAKERTRTLRAMLSGAQSLSAVGRV